MNIELHEPGEALQRSVSEHPFLRGLSEEHLKIMTDVAMLKDFEPGELIFSEGDIANRFYLITEGKVALESRQEKHPPILIQEIAAGDVLGWSWLFPPHYWRFDARAVASEPTKAIFFYGTRLREQCDTDPAFGYELMNRMTRIVVDRLQATRKQLI